MTQHILDRERRASAPRAPRYLAQERAQTGPHPATRSLMQRPRPEPARMDVYSRLDRQTARDET